MCFSFFKLILTTTSPCAVYGKPVLPTGKKQQTVISENTSFTSRLRDFDGSDIDYSFPAVSDDKSIDAETPESSTPRPLSPSKLLPFASNPHRNSDADLDGLRRRLHHAPRPLKKRSSIVEAEDPGGPNLQKLLYQKTTLAAMETISMENISTPGERIRLPVPDDGIVRKDVSSGVKDKSSAVLMSAEITSDSLTSTLLAFPDPRSYTFLSIPTGRQGRRGGVFIYHNPTGEFSRGDPNFPASTPTFFQL